MLGNNEESEKAINNSLGKMIENIDLVKDSERYADYLLLTFYDGYTLKIWDRGQLCCEHRYLHTDDELDDFVGTELVNVRVVDVSNLVEVLSNVLTGNSWDVVHEVQFLVIDTSLGSFTIETHNVHNGYYSGFWINAEEIAPEA